MTSTNCTYLDDPKTDTGAQENSNFCLKNNPRSEGDTKKTEEPNKESSPINQIQLWHAKHKVCLAVGTILVVSALLGLVIGLAIALASCLTIRESFNPAKTNTTLQPLLNQNEKYGVVLTQVKGSWYKYLIAKTTDEAPMVCIFLAEQVSIKNMSKSGTFEPGSQIIDQVYANDYFNFSAYISGQDLSSVIIIVQMIHISDRFWHEICKTNLSHSNSSYTYKCLSNIGGYYKVLYTNQKKDVQITYTLNYDGIDITTYKNLINCTLKKKTCELPLNVEKKYKVIAVIDTFQLYGSLNLTTILESRTYYYYIAGGGSLGISVMVMLVLVVLLLLKLVPHQLCTNCCKGYERVPEEGPIPCSE